MAPDEFRRLRPQQQTALKQLLMGASITEAAQAASLTRQTVSEWCNHHDVFQAELSERRASVSTLERCSDLHLEGRSSPRGQDSSDKAREPIEVKKMGVPFDAYDYLVIRCQKVWQCTRKC
jgi:hypothetical protein